MLNAGEHVELIGGELKLIVSKEHTFGTDAFLLADFSFPGKRGKAADLGTGCGIIPFLWLREGFSGELFAVDIQSSATRLLARSVAESGVESRMQVVNADIRGLPPELPKGHFDLVSMNPPYKPVGTGILSAGESDQIARHETECTLSDAASAAAKLLRFGGRFCICIRPERLCAGITSMTAVKIEPKRMRQVVQRHGLKPWLLLLEGRLGGNPGMEILPELCVESNETDSIIGGYRKML